MPTDVANLKTILGGKFTYTSRPDPMPGDLRMSWGLAVLLVALHYSRARKASFQKLQFLAHAVRIEEGRIEVRALLSGEYRPADVSVRVEPSINRAVAFAHALKLVRIERGISVVLIDEGAKAAQAIASDAELLIEEKRFLKDVAPRLTDALMRKVWRLEELL